MVLVAETSYDEKGTQKNRKPNNSSEPIYMAPIVIEEKEIVVIKKSMSKEE